MRNIDLFHPNLLFVQSFLQEKGVDLERSTEAKEDRVIFDFSDGQTTTVIYLMALNKPAGPEYWLAVEHSVGLMRKSEVGTCLISASQDIYTAKAPFRLSVLPHDSQHELLILRFCAPSAVFVESYIAELIEVGVELAEHLRGVLGLESIVERVDVA